MATIKKHHPSAKKEETRISADESMVKHEETQIRADKSMVKPVPVSTGGNAPWLVLAVVAILILAGGWWYLSQGAAKTGPNGTPANATLSPDLLATPNAVALLSSFDNLQKMPSTYNLTFAEPIDGIDSNISLEQKDGNRVAIITTAYNTREYYWIGGKSYACEQAIDEPRQCAEIDNESALMIYGGRLNATFPSSANAASQKADQANMIQVGALVFISPPQNLTVAGRNCTDLNYQFNFANLTPNQLAQINLSPNDPVVSVFRNYRVEKCVDTQLGLALISHLNYEYVDPTTQQVTPLEDKLTYQTFQSPLDTPLLAPGTNTNSSLLLSEVTRVNNVLKAIGDCQSAPNVSARDQCVRTEAINDEQVGMCNLVQDVQGQGQCVIIIAGIKNAPEDCPLAGNYSDECYANIAVNDKDARYCALITNLSNQQSCKAAVAQVQNAPANQSSGNAQTGPYNASTQASGNTSGNAVVPPTNNGSNNGLPTNNSNATRGAE